MPWIDENEEEEREKALLLEDEEEDDEEQQDMSPQEKIVSYWRSISPPTEEKDIKQTWCACTYPNKKSKSIVSWKNSKTIFGRETWANRQCRNSLHCQRTVWAPWSLRNNF